MFMRKDAHIRRKPYYRISEVIAIGRSELGSWASHIRVCCRHRPYACPSLKTHCSYRTVSPFSPRLRPQRSTLDPLEPQRPQRRRKASTAMKGFKGLKDHDKKIRNKVIGSYRNRTYKISDARILHHRRSCDAFHPINCSIFPHFRLRPIQ